MVRLSRILIFILIPGLALFSGPDVVQAAPVLPSSIYGFILLNDTNVPDGTLVQALIANQVYAYTTTQTYQGASVYSLIIPGDDPGTATVEGGKEGDIINFTVGGLSTNQTGIWHSGSNAQLNLTITGVSTLIPPQITDTPLPSETPMIIVVSPNPTSTAAVLQSTWTSIPSLTPTQPTPTGFPTVIVSGQVQGSSTSLAFMPILTATAPRFETTTPTDFPLPIPGTETAVIKEQNPNSFLLWMILPAGILIIFWIVRGWIIRQENHR